MPAKRILIVHNRYRIPGGEDTVVATESRLLRDGGCEVDLFDESNDGPFSLADAARLVSFPRARRDFEQKLRSFQPDVVHFHNIFYRIGPSAYWQCRNLGIPVVQTLHNFRIGCANARLSRDGRPCERCISGGLGRAHGIYHGCFQSSRAKTLMLEASISAHRWLGTFHNAVSQYICLSEFTRSRHIRSGIPAEKLIVKGNCVHPDPGPGQGPGDYALFAGRLEPDKGVDVLLEASTRLEVPILIAGEGSKVPEVRSAAATHPHIRFLGKVDRDQVLALMKSARLLLFPTLAYENFPMSIAEAFAVGLPVVTSRIGAAAEIVADGRTGVHFETGSSSALAAAIQNLWGDAPRLEQMRGAARAEFESKYSTEAAYDALQSVYDKALQTSPRALQAAS